MILNFENNASEKGTVLVTALLYLLVVTFLVICAFSSGILQTKMSEHSYEEMEAFEKAEFALLVGEKAILIDQIRGQGEVDSNLRYQFHQVSKGECGLFYQVDASARVAAAKIQLQSIFVFPEAGMNPCTGMLFTPHRVVWRQLQ